LPGRAAGAWARKLAPLFAKYAPGRLTAYGEELKAASYGPLFHGHIQAEKLRYLREEWPARVTTREEREVALRERLQEHQRALAGLRGQKAELLEILKFHACRATPPSDPQLLAATGCDIIAFTMMGGWHNPALIAELGLWSLAQFPEEHGAGRNLGRAAPLEPAGAAARAGAHPTPQPLFGRSLSSPILLGQPNAGSQEDGRVGRMQADQSTQRIYVRFIRLRIIRGTNSVDSNERRDNMQQELTAAREIDGYSKEHPRPLGTIGAGGVTPTGSVTFRSEQYCHGANMSACWCPYEVLKCRLLECYSESDSDRFRALTAPVVMEDVVKSRNFSYNVLTFGVNVAPAIFQRFMDTHLADIAGVKPYLDDILIAGSTKEEHDK
ncbi:Uncharacterized protein T02_3183, partial [Trichinella nativa]